MNLRKTALTGAIWKMLERLCAQGISFIVTVILARLIAPEEYGVISLVTIFFTFANVLISGGLNTALIQKKDADEKDYSTVFTVSIGISILIYFILFFTAPGIANIYQESELVPIIRVMSLSLPIYAAKSIVCAYTSATLQFKKFFFATLGGTLLSAVVGIIMAVKGFGAGALVAQQMTNSLTDMIILFVSTKLKVRISIYWNRLKCLFSYGWRILATSLIGNIYRQINPLIIGYKFSSADLSYYTKGSSISNMISGSVTGTLSSVLFPILSKLQDSKDQLLYGTRKFMQVVSYIVFPVMLGFLAVSDNFVSVVFTDKWLPASYYIKIFCIDGMSTITAVGNCETIKAMGRSDVYLKIEIVKKILYLITLGIFINVSSSPEMLAISVVVMAVEALIINAIPNIKLLGYSVKMQLQDLSMNLLLSLVMCSIVVLIGKLEINCILLLIIQIFAGATIYILLSLVTKNYAFNFLLSTFKDIIASRK